MPRANRYTVPGQTYHITHRCHNRDFLLRFKKDRDAYRRMLRERLQEHPIALFNYCITSNHMHLLLRPDPGQAGDSLSHLMQCLEGDFARYYNRRKRRTNAFWGERYHATMIDSGDHLWSCMKYIDLNMVRAGAVDHPRGWDWTGYQELMGFRKRNRLINLDILLEHLRAPSLESFRENYEQGLAESIRREELRREPKWTESLAVGSESFTRKLGGAIDQRMKLDVFEDKSDPSSWILRETQCNSYG